MFRLIFITTLLSGAVCSEHLRSHASNLKVGNLEKKVEEVKKRSNFQLPEYAKSEAKKFRAKKADGVKAGSSLSVKPKKEFNAKTLEGGGIATESQGYATTRYRLLGECSGPVEQVNGENLACTNFIDDIGFPFSRNGFCVHNYADETVMVGSQIFTEFDCNPDNQIARDDMEVDECEYRVARSCTSNPYPMFEEEGVVFMGFSNENDCNGFIDIFGPESAPRRSLKANNKKTIPKGKGRKSAVAKNIENKNKRVASKDHEEESNVPEPLSYSVAKANTCSHDSDYNLYLKFTCNPETNEARFEVFSDAACKDYVSSTSVRPLEDVTRTPIDTCYTQDDSSIALLAFCNSD